MSRPHSPEFDMDIWGGDDQWFGAPEDNPNAPATTVQNPAQMSSAPQSPMQQSPTLLPIDISGLTLTSDEGDEAMDHNPVPLSTESSPLSSPPPTPELTSGVFAFGAGVPTGGFHFQSVNNVSPADNPFAPDLAGGPPSLTFGATTAGSVLPYPSSGMVSGAVEAGVDSFSFTADNTAFDAAMMDAGPASTTNSAMPALNTTAEPVSTQEPTVEKLNWYMKEHSRLHELVKDFSGQADSLRYDVEDLNDDLANARHDKAKLETELEAKQQSATDYAMKVSKQLKKVKDERDALSIEAGRIAAERDEVRRQLSEAQQTDANSMRAERDEARRQLSETQQQRDAFSTEANLRAAERDDARRQLSEAQQASDEKESVSSQVRAELEAAKHSTAEREKNAEAEYARVVAEYEKVVEVLDKERKQGTAKDMFAQKCFDEARAGLEQLQRDLDKEKAARDEQRESCKKSEAALEKTIQTLKETIVEHEKKIEGMATAASEHQSNTELQRAFDELRVKYNDLQEEDEKLRLKDIDSEKRIREHESKIHDVRADLVSKDRTIQNLESQIADYKKEIQIRDEALAAKTAELRSRSSDAEHLEKETTALRGENTKLIVSNNGLAAAKKRSDQTIKDLRIEISQLKKSQEGSDVLQEKYTEACSSVEQLEAAIEDLNGQISKRDETIRRLGTTAVDNALLAESRRRRTLDEEMHGEGLYDISDDDAEALKAATKASKKLPERRPGSSGSKEKASEAESQAKAGASKLPSEAVAAKMGFSKIMPVFEVKPEVSQPEAEPSPTKPAPSKVTSESAGTDITDAKSDSPSSPITPWQPARILKVEGTEVYENAPSPVAKHDPFTCWIQVYVDIWTLLTFWTAHFAGTRLVPAGHRSKKHVAFVVEEEEDGDSPMPVTGQQTSPAAEDQQASSPTQPTASTPLAASLPASSTATSLHSSPASSPGPSPSTSSFGLWSPLKRSALPTSRHELPPVWRTLGYLLMHIAMYALLYMTVTERRVWLGANELSRQQIMRFIPGTSALRHRATDGLLSWARALPFSGGWIAGRLGGWPGIAPTLLGAWLDLKGFGLFPWVDMKILELEAHCALNRSFPG